MEEFVLVSIISHVSFLSLIFLLFLQFYKWFTDLESAMKSEVSVHYFIIYLFIFTYNSECIVFYSTLIRSC